LELKQIQDVALIKNEEIKNPMFEKIHRIEAYDISHLSGKEVYGSMVVFENSEKNTDQYRIFKIKNDKNNDIKSLAEVIKRRFKHLEWQLPDLVIVDGGKPQIDCIKKIFEKRNLNIILLGISKYSGDKIVYSKKMKKEFKQVIETNIKVLLQARNEAHRFANRFRKNKFDRDRNLRQK
jgi:excinuclease ABC subunit C